MLLWAFGFRDNRLSHGSQQTDNVIDLLHNLQAQMLFDS